VRLVIAERANSTVVPSNDLLAKRNDIRLGRAIHAVERLGRDADDGCVEDRALAARDESGRDAIGQACERGNVESDHGVHLLYIGIQQLRDCGDASIVSEQGDGRTIPQSGADDSF